MRFSSRKNWSTGNGKAARPRGIVDPDGHGAHHHFRGVFLTAAFIAELLLRAISLHPVALHIHLGDAQSDIGHRVHFPREPELAESVVMGVADADQFASATLELGIGESPERWMRAEPGRFVNMDGAIIGDTPERGGA